MDWLRRNPLLGVLAAACLLLAVVIGVEAGFGATLRDALRPAGPRSALPTDAKLLPPLIATAAEQSYPETTARPLPFAIAFAPVRVPRLNSDEIDCNSSLTSERASTKSPALIGESPSSSVPVMPMARASSRNCPMPFSERMASISSQSARSSASSVARGV